MDMVKPAPSNTALSEEYAVISDVNIHIPETFIENHTSVKAWSDVVWGSIYLLP